MRCLTFVVSALLAALALPAVAQADLMIYKIPGTGRGFILQGKVTFNPGGTVTLSHPKLRESLYFSARDVEYHKVPTTQSQFKALASKAVAKKDANAAFEAGVWALKHGMLKEFYQAVDGALKFDKKHPRALLVKELVQKMKQPISDSSQQEAELKELVKNPGFRIEKSAHFILYTDTPEKGEKGKPNRAQHRLALLEQVYESFLLLFYSQGIELTVPDYRMKVVLFEKESDYKAFALSLSPALQGASGFWEPGRNTGIFYDHGTDPDFQAIKSLFDSLEKDAQRAIKERLRGAGELIRLAKTLQLLLKLKQENQDITVVSHEATHQLAGNTGLFPREVLVPRWVHEGLASYFETPGDAAWAGIGAVNKDRLELYKAIEQVSHEISSIEFIVTDQIFDRIKPEVQVIGYGQAWALTHFMLERNFEKSIQYYRLLGEMPRNVLLGPDVLKRAWDMVFGDERGMEVQWRSYMQGLKTDIDLVLEKR